VTRPTIAAIATVVSEEFGFDIRKPGRVYARAHARWLAWYVARQHGYSLPEIGRYFGMDHTTVLYGVEKFRAQLDEELTPRQMAKVIARLPEVARERRIADLQRRARMIARELDELQRAA
jgi:chromosomal replication initiation ATPase DnaA